MFSDKYLFILFPRKLGALPTWGLRNISTENIPLSYTYQFEKNLTCFFKKVSGLYNIQLKTSEVEKRGKKLNLTDFLD